MNFTRWIYMGGMESIVEFRTDNDIAAWTTESANPHYITGDQRIALRKKVTPNSVRHLTPSVQYQRGARAAVVVGKPEVIAVGPLWDNTFSINWNVSIHRGTQPVRSFAGVITCDLCMFFISTTVTSDAVRFSFRKSWPVTFISETIKFVGDASVRYLMPRADNSGQRLVRMIIYQAYSLLSSTFDTFDFEIVIEGEAHRIDSSDGKLQNQDRIKVDLSAQVEDEWGQIAVEDFD